MSKKFHSLSPIKDADVEHYVTALSWALENREKEGIYNIALTGPYGSGKSSILQTFQAQQKNKSEEFLEISLATFKEEDEDKKDQKRKDEDILRLIELSILQQIFYHENDDKIPDSRFKKIKSFNRKSMYWITAGIMAAIIFGVNLFFPDKVQGLLGLHFGNLLALILHWLSLLIFLSATSVIIFRSLRVLFGLKISKLKFQEAEIEIDKSISKSILNNHLDEILYFFEVTPYSVVLIEDLDRFRQAEIFTKLRELNQLINHSKKIRGKKVVFIYAVRDEMFTNKDRTKFFDFIIPVIPVINSSNSNEKLTTLVSDNHYKISPDLIEDISLFIDDMRLLYNITNEYGIYRDLLDKKLDQDRLLAMIVYKNIYPDDFVLLGNNDGKLHELLSSRSKFTKETIKKIDEEIQIKRDQIKIIQNNTITNADELRVLYTTHFADKISGFRYFELGGHNINIRDAATATNFELFRKGDFTYYYFQQSYNNYVLGSGNANFRFDAFQKEVDPTYTFEERLSKIKVAASKNTESLKQDIDTLEKQKVTVRHAKLQDVLADKVNGIELDGSTKQGQLLSLLLRSGYINEDYLDYISFFYEGSISKSDRDYLLNVKSQQKSDYDIALQKIGNLIGKIGIMEFNQPYILNYSLLDFILSNMAYSAQLDRVLGQLNDSSTYGPIFIDGFITNGVNIEIFVNKLLTKWPGLWKYLDERSDYIADKKETYFKLLMANAAVEDIEKAAAVSLLEQKIAKTSDFLSLIPDENQLQNIIALLDVRFKDIVLVGAPKAMADFVYQGDYYKINTEMLRKVIAYAGEYDASEFEKRNYYALLNSKVPELVRYVGKSMERYINDVYLPLKDSTNEPEDALLALLNNKDIPLNLREEILKRSETKISELKSLAANELDKTAFEFRKILATWMNLMDYFRRNLALDEVVFGFLNDQKNYELLAAEDPEEDYLEDETNEAFFHQLLTDEQLNEDSYEAILDTMPYTYNVDEVEHLSHAKMQLLILHHLIDPTAANFEKLFDVDDGLQLIFLDTYAAIIMKNLADFPLGADEIAHMLNSSAFTTEQKLEVINSADPDMVIASKPALSQINHLLRMHHPFVVPKAILIAVLQQPNNDDGRVQLFNMYYKSFDKSDIPKIFNTFSGNYKKIGERYTSPVIDRNQENIFLANNLLEKKFISNVKEDKKGIKLINFKHIVN